MSIDNKKRHKNINRELIHDEMAEAAEHRGMSVTQYARMCGLDSHFFSDVLQKRAAPEHLLRQLARDKRAEGEKRHWRDYLLPDPEPEQLEMDLEKKIKSADTTATQIDHDIKNALIALEKAFDACHAGGYYLRLTVEKKP